MSADSLHYSGNRLPGTLEGVSVPGEQYFRVPGTLGPFPCPAAYFMLSLYFRETGMRVPPIRMASGVV